MLQQQLLKAAAIKELSISPMPGTVLVRYDERKIDVMTLTGVLAKLLGLEKELEKTFPGIRIASRRLASLHRQQ